MGKHNVHSLIFEEYVTGQSNKPLSQPPHSLTSQQVLNELRNNATIGLAPEEVSQRLEEMGPNGLAQKRGFQPVKILLEQVFNAMTLSGTGIGLGCEVWYLGLDSRGHPGWHYHFNIFLGFFQSLQAENTIDSLRTLDTPSFKVFRGAKTITIQRVDVIPGDIVDLEPGDSVPVDIRLIEAGNLEADEALLAGESVPILKIPRLTFDAETGPGDRLKVPYSSSNITKGRGRGVVFATGMFTEIGLIAGAFSNSGDPENYGENGQRFAFRIVWDPVRA